MALAQHNIVDNSSEDADPVSLLLGLQNCVRDTNESSSVNVEHMKIKIEPVDFNSGNVYNNANKYKPKKFQHFMHLKSQEHLNNISSDAPACNNNTMPTNKQNTLYYGNTTSHAQEINPAVYNVILRKIKEEQEAEITKRQEIFKLFTDENSLLTQIDLKDIINMDTYQNILNEQERKYLELFLSSVDNNIHETFRNNNLSEGMSTLQNMVRMGFFTEQKRKERSTGIRQQHSKDNWAEKLDTSWIYNLTASGANTAHTSVLHQRTVSTSDSPNTAKKHKRKYVDSMELDSPNQASSNNQNSSQTNNSKKVKKTRKNNLPQDPSDTDGSDYFEDTEEKNSSSENEYMSDDMSDGYVSPKANKNAKRTKISSGGYAKYSKITPTKIKLKKQERVVQNQPTIIPVFKTSATNTHLPSNNNASVGTSHQSHTATTVNQNNPSKNLSKKRTLLLTDAKKGKKNKKIRVEVDDTGQLCQPVQLGTTLTIYKLGEVEYERRAFHNDRHIWPIGFKSCRSYFSMLNPKRRCLYFSEILDGNEFSNSVTRDDESENEEDNNNNNNNFHHTTGPIFRVTADDDPKNPVISTTATGAWTTIVKTVNAKRAAQEGRVRRQYMTCSGPEMYGLSNPIVVQLIALLPNADKCSTYVKNVNSQHGVSNTTTPTNSATNTQSRGAEQMTTRNSDYEYDSCDE